MSHLRDGGGCILVGRNTIVKKNIFDFFLSSRNYFKKKNPLLLGLHEYFKAVPAPKSVELKAKILAIWKLFLVISNYRLLSCLN